MQNQSKPKQTAFFRFLRMIRLLLVLQEMISLRRLVTQPVNHQKLDKNERYIMSSFRKIEENQSLNWAMHLFFQQIMWSLILFHDMWSHFVQRSNRAVVYKFGVSISLHSKETRMKNESVSSCGRQDFNYLISTSSLAVWLDCAKNFSCVFLTWVPFPQTCWLLTW